MDDAIASFIHITNADAKNAENYLRFSDGNLEQALQLFFEMEGAELDPPASSNAPPPASVPTQPSTGSRTDAISIDDDAGIVDDDEDFRVALEASRQSGSGTAGDNTAPITSGSTRAGHFDEDAEMARRLQEEYYTDVGVPDTNGVRAPIARTTETLVGPEDAYMEQMGTRMRPSRRGGAGPAGIFNQRSNAPGSVWGEGGTAVRRQQLAEATGGASERSSKSHTLAEMYRPPYEIIAHLSLDDARDSAKGLKKWILVNIQDTSIFDSQLLNRDIWKSKEVTDTIKEHFLFLQYDRSGIDGQTYVRLYFPYAIDVPPTSSLNPFPIVAIVDPRTGEQVKVWTETPKNPLEFVMQLHEFLERYSLDNMAKNPVQMPGQSVRKLDVDHMTEDEMLDLALRNSLNKAGTEIAGVHHDPDQLTREQEKGKGKQQEEKEEDNLMDLDDDAEPQAASAPAEQTPFQTISQTNHHVEPPMGAPGTTRIQFKLADGSRVVRRFLLGDRVTRLYEWIKADLLPEQATKKGEEVTSATSDRQFELVSLGKNLIDRLDSTLEEAQLKMGTVMIEFVDSE